VRQGLLTEALNPKTATGSLLVGLGAVAATGHRSG
jgi:hypothetical protein